MANMNFGVNILPKANNTYSLGNSDYKWNIFANQINGTAISSLVLPTVTSTDNGQILKVDNGAWSVGTAPTGLPSVSSTDNGKILQVSSGAWSAATITIPTKVSELTNDRSYLRVPSQLTTVQGDTAYIPGGSSYSQVTYSFLKVTSTPTAYVIPKYDENAYLYATTPSANDNSTKVATTAYVNSAIPDISSLYTKPSSGIPSTDLADTYIEEPSSDGSSGQVLTTDGSGGRSWTTISTYSLPAATDSTLGGVKIGSNITLDNDGTISVAAAPNTMTGATSSTAGTSGLVPAPATTDVDKFLAGDGTYKSGGLPMVILSYGNSTWNDFITAYNNNVIVYCRASSNSNPASGSQTRMAFMAYVNNATTPTEVEFQYYRSMSSHSATAMGDQVFVYKITNKGVWSVTTRDASIKEINVASGSKLGVSWSSNKVTLSNTMTAADMPISTSDSTKVSASLSSLNTAIGTLNSNLGSPSSASAVTGADAFSKINSLNSKVNYKTTRYLNTALDYSGANVYNLIIQYLEKNEFLLLVEEIGNNKYIFAHVHFVQGTLKDSKIISNNGLDFGATNVNGTQVITGYSGSGAAGTLRWIAW